MAHPAWRLRAPLYASAILACAAAASCTRALPERAGQSVPLSPTASIETVPLTALAGNMFTYRGRTVRVCGTWDIVGPSHPNPDRRAWLYERVRAPSGIHQYSVGVLTCPGAMPRPGRACITGRVARPDGSLESPTEIFVGSHGTGSAEWWLHPQCASD